MPNIDDAKYIDIRSGTGLLPARPGTGALDVRVLTDDDGAILVDEPELLMLVENAR